MFFYMRFGKLGTGRFKKLSEQACLHQCQITSRWANYTITFSSLLMQIVIHNVYLAPVTVHISFQASIGYIPPMMVGTEHKLKPLGIVQNNDILLKCARFPYFLSFSPSLMQIIIFFYFVLQEIAQVGDEIIIYYIKSSSGIRTAGKKLSSVRKH